MNLIEGELENLQFPANLFFFFYFCKQLAGGTAGKYWAETESVERVRNVKRREVNGSSGYMTIGVIIIKYLVFF